MQRQWAWTWRLLIDTPMPGAWNMAVDETLLRHAAAHEQPPTLRLYAWQPLALSLGYAQPESDADLPALAAHGWEVVRRLTGGRAILHGDELTYSVTLPGDHPLAQTDIVSSYREISRAIMRALERLGANAQADALTEKAPVTTVCFETPSHYEITVGGRKLVGSAQARRHGGLLQHGTLPLYGDIARICDALAFPDAASREQARRSVRARALTLSDALGTVPAWETVAQAFVEGFADGFGITFAHDALSPAEHSQAEALQHSQYASLSRTT
jgi:lipoate-protein ligase A